MSLQNRKVLHNPIFAEKENQELESERERMKGNTSRTDFYNDGLTGKENSAEKRKALQKELGLPLNISANALLEVLNFLYSYEEYKAFLNQEEQAK